MVALCCHSTGREGTGTLRSATGQIDRELGRRTSDGALDVCFLESFSINEREREEGRERQGEIQEGDEENQ